MNLKTSLLAILATVLMAPTLSFAHGQNHLKTHLHVIAIHAVNAYSVHLNDNNFRYVKPLHQLQHHNNRADYLDHKGDRIDRKMDHKGERINNKLDRAAYQAWSQGDNRKARQLDRQGDKIERHYDRKGDRINQKLDRKSSHAGSHDRKLNHHNG